MVTPKDLAKITGMSLRGIEYRASKLNIHPSLSVRQGDRGPLTRGYTDAESLSIIGYKNPDITKRYDTIMKKADLFEELLSYTILARDLTRNYLRRHKSKPGRKALLEANDLITKAEILK